MKYGDFDGLTTPSYIFSEKEFRERARHVKSVLGERIRLVYAMKANPFLTDAALKEGLALEVCSPGEEKICEKADPGLSGEELVLSGVNKEEGEFRRIIARFGSRPLYTAESEEQLRMLDRLGQEAGKVLRVLLRVTSGNQFGMDAAAAEKAVEDRGQFTGVRIAGIQYFAGTQKRIKQTLREISEMDDFLAGLESKYGFRAEIFEFGPGLFVTYFEGEDAEQEEKELAAVSEALRGMRYNGAIAVEMGRFLAAPCGYYITAIADCKTNRDTLYCILDGGIHQINYYGQMMAMKVPHILTKPAEGIRKCVLCGSLCTTADILVREAEIPSPVIGDRLVFTRCGAYAVTEGISLFLTRDLPAVFTHDGMHFRKRRDHYSTEDLNYG